ncbi:MAG TPA: hypothetical protein VMW25_04790 [Clostridia bacterium]|nr:hypothetical protein [Clostridia bacterium]
MFEALHPTGKIFHAEEALNTLPNPKEENWVCPDCKEIVHLKKEHTRIDHRHPDAIIVSSHFSHNPNSTCKQAMETTTHYNRKLFILGQLYAKNVTLSTGKTFILIPQDEIKGKEKTVANRQADVLVTFKTFDPVFGAGIAFEVMETEKIESIENKMQSWVAQGYSFSYFEPNEFIGNRLKANKVIVKFPLIKLTKKVAEKLYSEIRENILELKNLKTVLDIEKKYNQKFTCATCHFSSFDKSFNLLTGLMCCWYERNTKNNQARPEKYVPEHNCNNYQPSYKKLKERDENE